MSAAPPRRAPADARAEGRPTLVLRDSDRAGVAEALAALLLKALADETREAAS